MTTTRILPAALCLLALSAFQPFSPSAFSTPAAMLPAVDGWTLSSKTETYKRDNLFDIINGAADIFLACNFVEMTAVDYTKNDTNKTVTVHMYRHATPDDAFAIYSAERNPGPTFLKIGAEGYREDGLVYFLCGNYYVKITTPDNNPEFTATMEKIARALAEKIDPSPALPAMLSVFPQQDKQPRTEAYITDSFLGHKFMLPAWRATYAKDGKQYHLFIIDGKTKAGIQKLLDAYIKFNKRATKPAEGYFVMPDRFNGDIPLHWSGRHLLGVINDTGAAIDPKTLLAQFAAALPKQAGAK